MSRRSNEPFFWALFSSGGMLAALVLPAVAALLWVAAPIGWVTLPAGEELASRLLHPLVRLGLWGFISLAMFHWAHRFRFTLYDGLQLYHLVTLIAVICYGSAIVTTLGAAWLLWTL